MKFLGKKKRQIETLKNNNKILTERNVDLNRRGVSYQKTISELSDINIENQETIKELKKEIKSLKAKLTKLQNSINKGE